MLMRKHAAFVSFKNLIICPAYTRPAEDEYWLHYHACLFITPGSATHVAAHCCLAEEASIAMAVDDNDGTLHLSSKNRLTRRFPHHRAAISAQSMLMPRRLSLAGEFAAEYHI